jgi:hypothetical protein
MSMETLKCTYCHTDPGTDKNGKWSGFRDADTNELVCWPCKRRHYQAKALRLGEKGMTYSEMPVINFQPQLNLNFLK